MTSSYTPVKDQMVIRAALKYKKDVTYFDEIRTYGTTVSFFPD